MDALTPQSLIITGTVLLALFGIVITIDKVIEIIKKWRQPSANIQEKLAADKQRLDAHEKDINNLTGMVNALCQAEVAHLTHEITGNGVDQLKTALKDLTNALIIRK